ncbi:MAG: sel1 repeat family protein, partial [Cyanobacteria bacterium HKST-UBA02]|nr:sel1 repeat family protein [Cyanobacteria bacterium HKST-UBA02]
MKFASRSVFFAGLIVVLAGYLCVMVGPGRPGSPWCSFERKVPPLPTCFTPENESLEEARLKLAAAEPDFPRHGYFPDNALQFYPVGSAFKLARAGNPDAEYLIGWMYESGLAGPDELFAPGNIGPLMDIPFFQVTYVLMESWLNRRLESECQAASWYMQAAEHGSVAACAELGHMFERGIGFGRDLDRAVSWYQKAAAKGDAFAMVDLGQMYESGSGVPQDFRKAMELYERASKSTRNSYIEYRSKSCAESLWAQKKAIPSEAFRKGESDAVTFVRKHGDAREVSDLAVLYDYGPVEIDRRLALELYRQSLAARKNWS